MPGQEPRPAVRLEVGRPGDVHVAEVGESPVRRPVEDRQRAQEPAPFGVGEPVRVLADAHHRGMAAQQRARRPIADLEDDIAEARARVREGAADPDALSGCRRPATVRSSDGVPAWVRPSANRSRPPPASVRAETVTATARRRARAVRRELDLDRPPRDIGATAVVVARKRDADAHWLPDAARLPPGSG